ncbi:MAG: hypothetical protein IPJ17_19665 [Holophagales bacterium]|nr:MAG: hypothetical protein IPJ17_19665 [Holophagales bacterium]
MQKSKNPHHRRRRLALVLGSPLLALIGFAVWSDVADAHTAQGPDVTVISLGSTSNYGGSGGLRGYAVGTTSCNVGNQPVWWCDATQSYCNAGQHPVIAQNMYRLKDGRFIQLGQSWLKHGFLSTNTPDSNCGAGQSPPHGGDQLGVGLTDTYGSTLNGGRPLGKRSEVNPTSGAFPFPYTQVSPVANQDQRLVVTESEIDPALNAGAKFWVEGHYITADDAAAGNGANNASYREVTVGPSPFNLTLQGSTIRERPAIVAWKKADAEVIFSAIDTPTFPPERFHAALKVTQPTAGIWHYEIALHNMDSDRAAQAFSVSFHTAATIGGAGFHDVDSHSGEPYSTTDWAINTDGPNGTITWSTDTYASNQNANALRWGTMYNFWFDADLPPNGASATITLFKPGVPDTLDLDLFQSFFKDGFETGDRTFWSSTQN